MQINLDEEGIERRRARIEDEPVEPRVEGETLGYTSHTQRCDHEMTRFKGTRPNAVGLHSSRATGELVVTDRWSKIRTDRGLFIAAKGMS